MTFECPIHDRSKCKLVHSLSLANGSGTLQVNCHTCGHGQTVVLPSAEALALHDEMHRHKELPKPAAPPADEPITT
jgi:hypothetical protein